MENTREVHKGMTTENPTIKGANEPHVRGLEGIEK